MADLAFRTDVLRSHGASGETLDELLAYTRNRFSDGIPTAVGDLPLPDEPFVAAWERYARLAEEEGAFACLRERLVQLRFPIAPGVSRSESYLRASRRGELPPPGEGVRLRRPGELRLVIHPTAAGRIPVLIAGHRDDFVTLVRAFTRRGEPDPVPDAMGACMVSGLNNWDRIAELRRGWEANPASSAAGGWDAAFREIVPRKELYQDRFVLLSRGPYSAVPAGSLGLEDGEWEQLSLGIRLEHECAHYFTRRVLGSMRNALHDELIADSTALLATCGQPRADWVLRFLGLESFPAYRAGGRLESYRGDPPLSGAGMRVLRSLVVAAARNLEVLAAGVDGRSPAARAAWILSLAARSLEDLAGPCAPLRPSIVAVS